MSQGIISVDSELNHLIVFSIDEQRFALPISVVKRVVSAVEMTVIPGSPAIFLGVVNMEGRIIPVVHIRKRFNLPKRELELSDRFIIAHTSTQTFAFIVDMINGVFKFPEHQLITGEGFSPNLRRYVEGVIKDKDGMILICNLDSFLSIEEMEVLNATMENTGEIE
jgi:purine-binding chemotaxis protein CheW